MRSFLLAGIAGALCLGGAFAGSAPARAQPFIGISVGFAPPPLPVYEQAPIPGPDYLWAPGYWAWGADFSDYYWVPGTWVQAPTPGYLWTPGYWAANDGAFVWNAGYWGPQVGYYGGVDYGFGYAGNGYEGGYWNGGHFFYNRSVNNIGSVNITNVYTKTVVVNDTAAGRVSYNGGVGGVVARPTPEQTAAARQPHVAATALQTQNERAASGNPALFASKNHGLPPVASTAHPGVFTGADVVKPKAGPATPYVLSATHGAKVPDEAKPMAPAASPPVAAKGPDAAKPADSAKADAVARDASAAKPALPASSAAAPTSATVSRPVADNGRDAAKPADSANGHAFDANASRPRPALAAGPAAEPAARPPSPDAARRPPASFKTTEKPAAPPAQAAKPSSPPPKAAAKPDKADKTDDNSHPS